VTPSGGIAFAASGARIYARPPGRLAVELGPPDAALLGADTRLLGSRATIAAVDEASALAVYVAPVGKLEDRVLRHDGASWTREDIEMPPGTTDFKVGAISGREGEGLWLTGDAGDGVLLFKRDETAKTWKPVALDGAKSAVTDAGAHPLPSPAESLTPVVGGLWIDARAEIDGAMRPVTMYYDTALRRVTRTWCDGPGTACDAPLGAASLPSIPRPDADTGTVTIPSGTPRGYRSFAWPGSGLGTRVITNPALGRTKSERAPTGYTVFDGTSFSAIRVGGVGSSVANGAFTGATSGWISANRWSLTRVGPSAPAPRLQAYPVPSPRPFRAVVSEPGRSPADPAARALAVGDDGRVARYSPERGWVAEQLPTSTGRATPRLNGVAWPEARRAHAVGAGGEMWLWRAETGLWERDENAPQDLPGDQYAGIAFQPGNPDRGYVITDAGRIFAYGKGWDEQQVPGLGRADSLTSIAFAGGQALVAAQTKLLVNDGGGWRIDEQAGELLSKNARGAGVGRIYAVAGLPDGGAVAAGNGIVIVRDRAGEPWRLADHQLRGTVTAVAATRDGDRVRAVAILDNPPSGTDPWLDLDTTAIVDEPGLPPTQLPTTPDLAYALVVRETAGGWADDTRAAYDPAGYFDCPYLPDAPRGLALDANGEGWIVGGDGAVAANDFCGPNGIRDDTGATDTRTSAIWRYAAAPAPPPAITRSRAPLAAGPARLLVGGQAACSQACARVTVPGHAPDRYLAAALDVAAELHATAGGPRALLYTGNRIAPEQAGDADEQTRYASLVATATGRVPVFVAPSGTDAGSDAATFSSAFAGLPVPQGGGWAPGGISTAGVPGGEPVGAARTHYAFDTTGPEGPLRVVVIDNSKGSLAASDPHQVPTVPGGQRAWLVSTLEQARRQGVPTVVMGSRALSPVGARSSADFDAGPGTGVPYHYLLPADDGADVARLLVEHGASAYVFDANEQNVVTSVPAGAADAIPAIGSGALGYAGANGNPADAGFALLEFELGQRNPATNRVPVRAAVAPVLDDLTIDPRDGQEIRRSSPALFIGLGRRPRVGRREIRLGGANPNGVNVAQSPSPYVRFPNEACRGRGCTIETDFTFTSSNPEIGDFVRADPAQPGNPRAVFLDGEDKPVSDSRSGLFCAFNAGETTVRITAGGLTYATTVRVQGGSARRPCGTRPVAPADPAPTQAAAPAAPAAAPPPAVAPNPTIAPPPPVAAAVPAPAPPAAAVPPPAAQLPVIPPLPALPPIPAPLATPLVPIPPPPVSSVARPSPPGGATVRVYEEKREEEEAFEQSSAAVRYEPGAERGYPSPGVVVGMAILAAAAGSSIARRQPGRRRPIAKQQVR
jgi:hypothetical protein